MDGTHIYDFRKIKYVHVNIETFLAILVATALTREVTKNVSSNCLHYFFMLDVPNQIKADNGNGYYSQAFEIFCQQFNVTHITGIPSNSQGQDIVKL
jgi:transposase InsO family protein